MEILSNKKMVLRKNKSGLMEKVRNEGKEERIYWDWKLIMVDR